MQTKRYRITVCNRKKNPHKSTVCTDCSYIFFFYKFSRCTIKHIHLRQKYFLEKYKKPHLRTVILISMTKKDEIHKQLRTHHRDNGSRYKINNIVNKTVTSKSSTLISPPPSFPENCMTDLQI